MGKPSKKKSLQDLFLISNTILLPVNSHSIFKKQRKIRALSLKSGGSTTHRVHCYLLSIIIKHLCSWHMTYLHFEFLAIGINNYFKKCFIQKQLFLTRFCGFFILHCFYLAFLAYVFNAPWSKRGDLFLDDSQLLYVFNFLYYYGLMMAHAEAETSRRLVHILIIHSLVFSLRGRAARNQSPVMWLVWIWHSASWTSSWG